MTELDTAVAFFHACESAKGWEGCREYAEPDASFPSAVEAFTGVETLREYCDGIQASFTTTFVGSDYALVAAGYDAERRVALLQAVSYAVHTGEGGPVPPTHKKAEIPFVYALEFTPAGKIAHLEKIYDQAASLRALGWPEKTA